MPGAETSYTTRENERFTGYLTQPAGEEKLPGILVITSIFGIDEEMKALTDAFADDGFLVSVPDIFWRTMPGPVADFETALGRMQTFDFDQGVKDVEDLINDLRAHPRCNGKVAVLGFCFGGRYALVSAARFGVDAAASYHGTDMEKHLDEVSKVSCPVSFHFGDSDPAVPTENAKAVRSAFEGRDNAEITIHEGAAHNFSMPTKPGYHPQAAKESRAAVLRCFSQLV